MRKYRNKKVGGFDSIKEKNRIDFLKILEKQGKIKELKTQVRFKLIPAQYEEVDIELKTKVSKKKVCIEKSCSYVADATYFKDGVFVVEDTKGFRTKDYIIKKKLMLWIHGIKIKEV